MDENPYSSPQTPRYYTVDERRLPISALWHSARKGSWFVGLVVVGYLVLARFLRLRPLVSWGSARPRELSYVPG